MKLQEFVRLGGIRLVSLRVRVWIEMTSGAQLQIGSDVTLRVRVWIEISKHRAVRWLIHVTLRVRVWIEI